MFGIPRQRLASAIHIMQRKSCGYDSGKLDENPPEFCDCKYGWDGTQKEWEEQNKCPELRLVYQLLSAMTDDEYVNILHRQGNIIID